MNWWITLIILVIITVAGIIAEMHFDNLIRVTAAICAGFSAVLILAFCIVSTICVPKEIAVFEQQKNYIETHTVSDSVENAALTNKKTELNQWLFEAQYKNEQWGGWTFYPDSVQCLEPIR